MSDWDDGTVNHAASPEWNSGVSQSGARRQVVGKSPDTVLPGDIVIPSRGRYQGIQCEVKDVLRGKYNTYRLVVVPTIPVADDFSVDYNERVKTLVRERG